MHTEHASSSGSSAGGPSVPEPVEDPIPEPLGEILALFGDELAGLRFGDVDGEALEALAAVARERAAAVDQARALLEAAKAGLVEALDELAAKARRGLAYARVYAEDDPALALRLEALTPERGTATKRRRRRSGAKARPAPSPEVLPFAERGAA